MALKKIAKKTGLPFVALLKELRELTKPKDQRKPNRLSIFADLNITLVAKRSPKNGRRQLHILETEATSIRGAIKRVLKKGKPKGYSHVSEITKQLELTRTAQRRQLADSLNLWIKNGQLKSVPFLAKVPGKNRMGEFKSLRLFTAYETKTAIQLWEELDAKAATKKNSLSSAVASKPRPTFTNICTRPVSPIN